MLTLITCPTCHHKFSIPEGNMGQRRTCPNCQSIFVAGKSEAESTGRSNGLPRRGLLERAGDDGVTATAAPPIDRTMLAEVAQTIRYNCPRCKKPLESPANEAGTKKPCPHCGGRLQVPALPPGPVVDPLNKTLLAESMPQQAAPPSPVAAPAATPAPAATEKAAPSSGRWQKYAIGGLVAAGVAFAVLYFNGKHNAEVEHEKLLQAQKAELDKLKAEIDLKTAALEKQQKLDAEQRQKWDEQRAKLEARQSELNSQRELELKKLALLNDEKQAAEAKAKLDQKQRELEEERKAAAEQRAKAERDTQAQLDAIRRQLDNANQKSTTIIQTAPPPAYPWWHHYYRYPW
jgi:DNA-directed RNA polymerase subunit RPC12/RpoP